MLPMIVVLLVLLTNDVSISGTSTKQSASHIPGRSENTSQRTSRTISITKTNWLNRERHIHQSRTQHKRQSHSDRRVIPWVSIAVLLKFLFFFRSFAAPFFDPLGEPRRATAATTYFTFLAFIYIWLASVTTLTVLPHVSTNFNVIIATALFFYMTFVSISALLVGRLAIRSIYYAWLLVAHFESSSQSDKILNQNHIIRDMSEIAGKSMKPRSNSVILAVTALKKSEIFPKLIRFHRPFRRIFKCAVVISATLCLLYAHCWSRSLYAFKASRETGASLVCICVFRPLMNLSTISSGDHNSECHSLSSCADERLIWLLWAGAIIGHLFYFSVHEFSGKHLKDYRPTAMKRVDTKKMNDEIEVSMSSISLAREGINDMDDNEHNDNANNDGSNHEGTNNDLLKSPWSISSTIKKFSKAKIERPIGTLAMVPWFHIMLIKSGFDILISLHIFLGRFDARKMQVALLRGKVRRRKTIETVDDNQEGVFDFNRSCPCGEFPGSSDEMSGFWFDFMSDCGDGFNSSYQVARCLAQPTLEVVTSHSSTSNRHNIRTLPRGKILMLGGDLAYPDPTPETYENRFFRTFEDALPPPPSFRKEHISIHKPALPVKGWSLGSRTSKIEEEEKKCSDSPTNPSIVNDDEAGRNFASYTGPVAFAIPGNHDWFDGLATYTRYILSRDWLGGWLMPQQTSYFALQLPHGWWILGMDLALDNDINIEQFGFFADLAENSMHADDNIIIVTHIPFWVLTNYDTFSEDSLPETNLMELMKTHFGGRVRLRLAGDLHHYTRHMPCGEEIGKISPNRPNKALIDDPVLIVSGGGGAFLHPTHCFENKIEVGLDKKEYMRVAAYPSIKVSQHLSWLNLWQFRWRNWRLDIIWAVTYFGICSSFFPLCGVYEDYLKFNPTHHPKGLVLWAFSRMFVILINIFISGRVSLVFTLLVVIAFLGFTDSSKLKFSTYLAWSLLHSFAHVASAIICLLFVECLAEFIVSEGLVATEHSNLSISKTSGTSLASSIYNEYRVHFSHTLDDFQLMNTTIETMLQGSQGVLLSSRSDERFYEMLANFFSWMYNSAPLLKTTLAVFDLPGIIGSAHVKMCQHLCSNSSECLYSNNFAMFQQIDRVTVGKYIAAISFYYAIFAVPLAGNVFGAWLALTLNVLKCQYNEGFSSLRLEHWKNFVRMHIDEHGDLEIFSIGLHRVPKFWIKDPRWDGDAYRHEDVPIQPSWAWTTPSKWIPGRSSKKFLPEVIDYTKIENRRNHQNKSPKE